MQELFKVRLAKKKDHGPIISLVERAAARLCAKMGTEQEQAQWVQNQKHTFTERLADPDSDVLVAVSRYGIVGVIYLQHGGQVARDNHCDSYMGGLYSAVRGLGIGSKLNQEALLCAAARGSQSIYARLPKANKAAIRELQDLGFKRLGEQPSTILTSSAWVRMEMQLLHGALEDGQSPLPQKRRA